MKNLGQTILTVLASALVTLILNSLIGYFTQDNGSIMIGPVMNVQGKSFLTIDLYNFNEEPLNNLMLSIPQEIDIHKIESSEPIQINELQDTVGNNNDKKRITISGFQPNQVTRIHIPLSKQIDGDNIRVVNYKQLKLGFLPLRGIYNPIKSAFKNALVTTALYSILLFIFLNITDTKFDKLAKERERVSAELNKEITRVGDRVTESQNDYKNYKKQALRTKLLLHAQLSEYSQELQFWRDTIRKILYQSNVEMKKSEKILTAVTDTLTTYGTRANNENLKDSVKMLQEMILDIEESEGNQDKKA